jgi:hypothetical protein
VCQFGTPHKIITDQGTNFESQLIQALCKALQIVKARTSAYHPQANGQVERMNRTIKQILACYTNTHHNDWDMHLSTVTFAYNTARNEATQHTPFEIVFGRQDTSLFNIINPVNNNDTNEYVRLISNNKQTIQHMVQQQLTKSKLNYIKHYDRQSHTIPYQIKQHVWLTTETHEPGHTHKFTPKYDGPYEIVEQTGPVNYKIQHIASGKVRTTHHNRLRPYIAPVSQVPQPASKSPSKDKLPHQTRSGRIYK